MTLRLGLVLLCLLGLIACAGRALDLDHEAPPPTTVVEADPGLPASLNRLSGVWVDGQRLYWLAAGNFQGCLKTDCKRTTLTYATEAYGGVAIDGGHVYWVSGGVPNIAYTCPAQGCSASPETIVQDDDGWQYSVFAYQDYFYWSSFFDIYRCPASGCAATPEVVASGARAAALVFEGARAYWVDSAGGIFSAPVDGSEPPQLLTSLAERGNLAVKSGHLYWTAGTQVFRCAIASCDASPPTLLATSDSDISELAIDDTTLYWLAANSLHSCPLSGCEQSRVFTPPQVPATNGSPGSSFAIDASDIYWIDAGDLTNNFDVEPGKAIRKTAK